MGDELLALTAPVAFWQALRTYAQWLLDRANAPDDGYCPRIGAQQAAEAYLTASRRIRAKTTAAVSLSVSHWTWLARGLYEAEMGRDNMPATIQPATAHVTKPGPTSWYLAWLLRAVWPAWHGATRVDLTEWGAMARYVDWQ